MKKYKRVHFQLNSSVNFALEEYADELGRTKSYLLRKWIKNFRSDSITLKKRFYPRSSKKINCYFNIELETYDKLTLQAKLFGISTSLLLHTIITQNLSQNPAVKQAMPSDPLNLQRLWNSGKLAELEYVLGYELDKLSIYEVVLFIKTHTLLNQFILAKTGLVALEQRLLRDLDNTYYGFLVVWEAYLIYLEGNLQESLYLINQALNNPSLVNDRHVKGFLYHKLGRITRVYYVDLEKAEQYLQKALYFLDVYTHPFLIIEILFDFIRIKQYRLDFAGTIPLFNFIEEILLEHNNFYYWGRYFSEFGSNAIFHNNDFATAEASYSKGLEFFQRTGSIDCGYYIYNYLTLLTDEERDEEKAYKYSKKAYDIELKIRPHIAKTHRDAGILYYKAKENPQEAIKDMKELLKTEQFKLGVYDEFNNWAFPLACAQFLYSDDSTERAEGIEFLQRMSENGKTAFDRRAAQKTLEEKWRQNII